MNLKKPKNLSIPLLWRICVFFNINIRAFDYKYNFRNESSSSTASKKSKDKESPIQSDNAEVTLVAHELESKLNIGDHNVPEGIEDFDKEIWDDVFQVSQYAMDIFTYLKSEEVNTSIIVLLKQ